MKQHNSKVSDENVTHYAERLTTAALFPPIKARRYGNRAEVINGAGADLLAAIHGEIGDWEENEAAARKEWDEEQDRLRDLGLITEINTKRECDDLAETVDRCAALLARHHGFAHGFHRVEDKTGYNRAVRLGEYGKKAVESEE